MRPVALNISSPSLNCAEVALFLRECGVLANVAANTTVALGRDDGATVRRAPALEIGCRIVFHSAPPELSYLWPELKTKFGLGCAFVDAAPRFQGCVYDYLRATSCPGEGC